MDALAPLKQVKELEATQGGLRSLSSWSPLLRPACEGESMAVADADPAQFSTEFLGDVLTVRLAKKERRKGQQEEVADEITAWWQKTLGAKAVLGQASNRPSLGQRAPSPKLQWTKPDSGHAQQERNVVEVIPRAIEKQGSSAPVTQERKGPSLGRSLSTPRRLMHWSGVIDAVVFFLAVMFLRSAVAVFETIRWALGILTVEFRRVKRWSHSIRGLVAANESTTGKA